MPFLIAVTGGQGAGKSTLARMLAARLGSSATLCAGISERVRSGGHPMGQAATDSTILAYAAEHLRREADASGHAITILDRSLIDLDAYASLLASGPVARLAATLARDAATRYGATILVPTPPHAVGRAGPDESLEFRKRIADAVEERARHLDCGLIVAPSAFGERPEFVETVAARVREEWSARDA